MGENQIPRPTAALDSARLDLSEANPPQRDPYQALLPLTFPHGPGGLTCSRPVSSGLLRAGSYCCRNPYNHRGLWSWKFPHNHRIGNSWLQSSLVSP